MEDDSSKQKLYRKRVKIIKDVKANIGDRLKAYSHLLDANDQSTNSRFVSQHHGVIFHLLLACFIKAARKLNKNANQKKSDTSDFQEIVRITNLIRVSILYSPHVIEGDEYTAELEEILKSLLVPRNHQCLRLVGVHLLLVIINHAKHDRLSLLEIYISALDFDAFYGSDNIFCRPLSARPNHLADVTPLAPSVASHSVANLVEIFQCFFDNLEQLANAAVGHDLGSFHECGYVSYGLTKEEAKAQLKASRVLFLTKYTCLFFDLNAEQQSDKLFLVCPPELLETITMFMWKSCTFNPSRFPGFRIYRQLVKEDGTFRLVDSCWDQVMSLPTRYSSLKEKLVLTLGSWLYDPEEDVVRTWENTQLNAFVRHLVDSAAASFQSDESRRDFSSSLISPMDMAFSDQEGPWNDRSDMILSLCREIILFLRGLCAGPDLNLEEDTWKTILNALLVLKDEIFYHTFSRPGFSSDSEHLRDSILPLLFESMFVCWIRSQVQDRDLWNGLAGLFIDTVADLDCVLDEWEPVFVAIANMFALVGCGQRVGEGSISSRRGKSHDMGSSQPTQKHHSDHGSFSNSSPLMASINFARQRIASGGLSDQFRAQRVSPVRQRPLSLLNETRDVAQSGSHINEEDASTRKSEQEMSGKDAILHDRFSAVIECERFRDLENVAWTPDSVQSTFKQVITVSLKALLMVKNPLKLQELFKMMVRIWKLLGRCTNNGTAAVMLISQSHWIKQAALLEGSEHTESRRIGYQRAVDMFTSWESRHYPEGLADDVLQLMKIGLEHEDFEVNRIVLDGIFRLFKLGTVPDVSRLIDPVTTTMERVVKSQPSEYLRIDQGVKLAGFKVLGSIVTMRSHPIASADDSRRARDMRTDMISICLNFLTAEDPHAGDSSISRISVSFLSIILFEAIYSADDEIPSKRCAAGLIQTILHSDVQVSRIATACFIALGRSIDHATRARTKVQQLLDYVFQTVFRRLHQRLDRVDDSAVTIDQIHAIGGWLEQIGSQYPRRKSNDELLYFLERCVQYKWQNDFNPNKNQTTSVSSVATGTLEDDSPTISRSAENILILLTIFMNEQTLDAPTGSKVVSEQPQPLQEAVFCTATRGILSVSLSNLQTLCVIYRDKTGKYCWEYSVDDFDDGLSPPDVTRTPGRSRRRLTMAPEIQNIEEQLPWLLGLHGHCRLRNLLRRLRKLLVPNESDSSDLGSDFDVKDPQAETESRSVGRSCSPAGVRFSSLQQSTLTEPKTWPDGAHITFAPLRLLDFVGLSALLMGRRRRQAKILETSQVLSRELRLLDCLPSKARAKIAVIYVGPNQVDESAVFSNSQGSSDYNAFVNSLGPEIPFSDHTGFTGGLDYSHGKLNYYSSPTVEVVFHDSTKLPSDQPELNHVSKKKHIGNDRVHIIWNESGIDYRPEMITTNFGNIVLVVIPLSQELRRVEVHSDPEIPTFGPIVTNVTLSRACAVPLIRETAINGDRAALEASRKESIEHPFDVRAREIAGIVNQQPSRTIDKYLKEFYSNEDTKCELDAAIARHGHGHTPEIRPASSFRDRIDPN